jgi:hypothetical protein
VWIVTSPLVIPGAVVFAPGLFFSLRSLKIRHRFEREDVGR